MMTVAVHERWSGQAARASALRQFIEHAQSERRASASCGAATSRAGGSTTTRRGEDRIRRRPARSRERHVLVEHPVIEITAAVRPRRWPATACRPRGGACVHATGGRCSEASRWTCCASARRRCITPSPRSRRCSAASRCTSRSRSPARSRTARRSSRRPAAGGGLRRRLPVACARPARRAAPLLRGVQPGMSKPQLRTRPRRRGATSTRSWFTDPRASGGHPVRARKPRHRPPARSRVRSKGDTRTAARAGFSRSRAARGELDDAVASLLRVRGRRDRRGELRVERAGPAMYALDVHAAGVSVDVALEPRREIRGRAPDPRSSSTAPPERADSSVRRFLESVRSGDPASVACSPEDALATLAAVLACERASLPVSASPSAP